MNGKQIETRLEQMAREMLTIAKNLGCSVDLHITRFSDGSFGGELFKIDQSAINYSFRGDKRIDFRGFAGDKRHLLPRQIGGKIK